MRKNQLHIFSIAIGSLLIIPLVIIILLQLRQEYLSRTAYERMESSAITTVSVPESKVVWREEGREVTIDGEYFDLVSWTLENGIYTFTGVYDREETAVANLLEKQSGSQSSLIRLLLIGQCFAAMIRYLFHFHCLSALNRTFFLFEDHYKFNFRQLILTPPRPVVPIR